MATGSDQGTVTAQDIEKSYDQFASAYRDVATLYSADDFRTPGEKKYLAKLKLDAPETSAKIASSRKRLDQLQRQMRNTLSLQAIKAGPYQFPRVYKLAKRAAAPLDLGDNFNIFILNSSELNAFTYSYNPNDFDIILHSAPSSSSLTKPCLRLSLMKWAT